MRYFLIIPILTLLLACNRNTDKVSEDYSENTAKKYLDAIPLFKTDSLIDKRDGKKYSTIKIGRQIWTVDYIECIPSKGKKYRDYLYNWEAAEDATIKPFEIPTENDWNELFKFVYDSIIMKSSPSLLKQISEGTQNHYSNRGQPSLPFNFKIDSIVHQLKDSNFDKAYNNEDFMPLMFFFLEKIGFSTRGSGFRYNGGLGVDDYSYFWTSTKDKSGDHKYVRIYTGSYCQGCGYIFSMPFTQSVRSKKSHIVL